MLSTLLVALMLQGAPASSPPKPEGYYDKVLCKHVETTGSRLGGKRVCMTRGEWEERAKVDKAELERTLSTRGTGVRTY